MADVIVNASEECQVAVVETFEGKREPDFTVTKATPTFSSRGLFIAWETVSAGFGELSIFPDEDGRIVVDSEAMGKGFVAEVLVKMLEGAEWQL